MVTHLPKLVSTDTFDIRAVAEGNPTQVQMRIVSQIDAVESAHELKPDSSGRNRNNRASALGTESLPFRMAGIRVSGKRSTAGFDPA